MMLSDLKTARELIDFYLEAGADALLGEQPVDRFAAVETTPASTTGALPPPERGRSIREADRVGVITMPNDVPTRSVLRTDHPPLSGEG